jgi:putative addiction module component (TIGR02574 family)
MSPELAAILNLSRAERLQLVEDLWDSLAAEGTDLPLAAWKVDELRRRKRDLAADPSAGLSWDEVKAKARSLHG